MLHDRWLVRLDFGISERLGLLLISVCLIVCLHTTSISSLVRKARF